jgi:catechol 2,3-dioxygenase-like lactoylglutathione lyase family enzyme
MIALADFAVSVSNAEASAQWWTEKLGFKTRTLTGSEHAVLVAPPGQPFLLHLCEGFEPVSPGNTGIAFVTDEIETLVPRLQAAGVSFPEPLRKTSFGGSAKFADPDGNVFWLIGAPREFIETETRRLAEQGPSPRSRRTTRPSTRSRAR